MHFLHSKGRLVPFISAVLSPRLVTIEEGAATLRRITYVSGCSALSSGSDQFKNVHSCPSVQLKISCASIRLVPRDGVSPSAYCIFMAAGCADVDGQVLGNPGTCVVSEELRGDR